MKISRELGQVFAEAFNRRNVSKMSKQSNFVKRKDGKLNSFKFLLGMTLGRFKKSGQYSLLDSI